jgi:hypothetical protein
LNHRFWRPFLVIVCGLVVVSQLHAKQCANLLEEISRLYPVTQYTEKPHWRSLYPPFPANSARAVVYTNTIDFRPAKSQCESACWANALTSALGHILGREFSANHLMAYHLMTQFQRRINTTDQTTYIQPGCVATTAVEYINTGALAYESTHPSSSRVNVGELVGSLNSLAKWYNDWAYSLRSVPDAPSKESLAEAVENQARKLIEANFGFRMTRREEPLLRLKSREVEIDRNSNESVEFALEEIARNIDAAKNEGSSLCLLSYTHNERSVNYETGTLELGHFNGKAPGKRAHHGVVVSGYRRDPETGNITHLRLQNSHEGATVLHMTREYFEMAAWNLSIISLD